MHRTRQRPHGTKTGFLLAQAPVAHRLRYRVHKWAGGADGGHGLSSAQVSTAAEGEPCAGPAGQIPDQGGVGRFPRGSWQWFQRRVGYLGNRQGVTYLAPTTHGGRSPAGNLGAVDPIDLIGRVSVSCSPAL